MLTLIIRLKKKKKILLKNIKIIKILKIIIIIIKNNKTYLSRNYNNINSKNRGLKNNKFKNKFLNKIEYYNYKKKDYYVIIYIKLRKLSNNFNKIFVNAIDEYKLYVIESSKKKILIENFRITRKKKK